LFVNKAYFARAQGLAKEEVLRMTPEELAHSVPAGARFVGCNDELLVITNRSATSGK
jgi:hypothetical protein